MTTVQNYINGDFLSWLQDNNFKYRFVDVETDKGALNILFNQKFCLKIYDRLGHGFGVTINVTEKYDESIYDNDDFNLDWAFQYLKTKQTASFRSRTEAEYLNNLPHLMNDIRDILLRLNKLTSSEWNKMKEWISKEPYKQFS